MTQTTTCHKVFQLYLTELVKRLIKMDQLFRENSVILLDDAAYH